MVRILRMSILANIFFLFRVCKLYGTVDEFDTSSVQIFHIHIQSHLIYPDPNIPETRHPDSGRTGKGLLSGQIIQIV